jgi:hypothetical protein
MKRTWLETILNLLGSMLDWCVEQVVELVGYGLLYALSCIHL